MEKLILISDEYPYGHGEKTFIEPELDYLKDLYDVTVVSCASRAHCGLEDTTSELPSGVRLLHWLMPSKMKRMLLMPAFFFSHAGWIELRSIVSDGLTFTRLLESMKEFSRATCFRRFCKARGLFDDVENTVFYSFWFGPQNLALALQNNDDSMLIISRAHGYDVFNERRASGRQPFQRFKRDRCRAIFFASEMARSYFQERFGEGVLPSQYRLSRLGVFQHRANPLGEPGSKKRIISCSNVIPLKRVHLIVEAISLLKREGMDVEWIHFGDGELLDEIKASALNAGISASFPGHMDNGRIIELYETIPVDAFVHVSSSEGGCPVAIQEALSCGIPIIGTDVGGIPETIDGNGILLSENPSGEDIAEAIKSVLTSSLSKRLEMREQSRRIWLERFDARESKRRFVLELQDIQECYEKRSR